VETEKGPICATEINPETRTLMKYGYCEEEKAKSKSPPSLKKSISNERKSKTLKVKKVKLKANAKKIKLILEDTPPQMEERKPSKKISKSYK
jgi:hypothetical protein